MAIVFDGPVTPEDATTFTRLVPTPANLVLNQLLPDRYIDGQEVDFNVVTKRGRTARFRALDAPAHRSARDTLVTNRVPLLPVSDSKPVRGEQEIARLYGLSYGNSPVAPAAQAIYDDLSTSTQDILRKAELTRGAVLSSGTLPINEGGLVGTLDYGVPSGNKLTAPTLWSSTGSADIVTFLNTARAAYIALNGFAPGGMTTSTPVLTLMQQNTKLQSMVVQQFGPNLGGYAGLLPQSAISAILGAYNMPGLSLIYDTMVDVDGNNTLVIPNNVVILTPPAGYELGYTAWGPTVTAQKLAVNGDISAPAPGITGFIDRADDFPYKESTIADALMLPVVENPNYLMILTVA
jgi:hypothetical protein